MFVLICDKARQFSAGAPRLRNWLLAGLEIHGTVFFIDTARIVPRTVTFKTSGEIESYFIRLQEGQTAGVRNHQYYKYLRYVKNLLDFGVIKAFVSVLLLITYTPCINKNGRKVAVFTSPSFHNILFGACWKFIFSRDTVIADMRDEWSKHPDLKKCRAHRTWEKFVLSRFDRVVTVSSFIKNRIDVSSDRVSVVYNNSAPQLFDKSRRSGASYQPSISTSFVGGPAVRYFGGLHPDHYDYALLRDLVLSNPNITFEFFSNKFSSGHPISVISNEKNVRVKPMVSRDMALQIQRETGNINLFICHKGKYNAGVVSTKLTEYIFSGNPILILDNCPMSDVTKIVEKYCQVADRVPIKLETDDITVFIKRDDVFNPGNRAFVNFLMTV